VTNAACQAQNLQHLLPALSFQLHKLTQIFNDNQSAITIMHKPIFAWPKQLKHVTIRHGFIYDHIQQEDVSVSYILTDKNLADFLTKHVATPKLKHDKQALNLSV